MIIYMQLSDVGGKGFMASYMEAFAFVEGLYRLLLDVVKHEFERVGVLEITAVQASCSSILATTK